MENLKWLINTKMLQGALAGVLMFCGAEQLQDTWRHRGPGYVTYGEPDRDVEVAEDEYKRDGYASGFVLLGVGIFFWVFYARGDKDEVQ